MHLNYFAQMCKINISRFFFRVNSEDAQKAVGDGRRIGSYLPIGHGAARCIEYDGLLLHRGVYATRELHCFPRSTGTDGHIQFFKVFPLPLSVFKKRYRPQIHAKADGCGLFFQYLQGDAARDVFCDLYGDACKTLIEQGFVPSG